MSIIPDTDSQPTEPMLKISISHTFRDKIAAMIDRVFITGKRCSLSARGREVRPHQLALLEAAWAVAERHPDEFSMEIMRRTEPRSVFGVQIGVHAARSRPR